MATDAVSEVLRRLCNTNKNTRFGAIYGPLALVLTFFHCQKKSNRTKIMVFSYHLKSAAEI